MAELRLGNVLPSGGDNVVVEGKYVKGGYVVVASIEERDALKGGSGENIVRGSLCYVTGTDADPINQFYQYNGQSWEEKVFGITTDATAETSGLMSAEDKKKLIGIAAGAEVNVQPDWSQTDDTADDYIKNKPLIPTVPTKVSAFENDQGYLTAVPTEYITETELNNKGYLTSYTETDPTVPDWAKEETKPSYNLDEVSDTTSYVRMKATERTKLSKIAEEANKYTHPEFNNGGTYTKVVIDKDGHVTEGSNPDKIADLGVTDVYTKEEIDNAFDVALEEVTNILPIVNNGTLTIKKNEETVGTFTANQASNTEVTIEVPTKVSELTNDSNFIKADEAPVQSVNGKIGVVELTASDVKARPETWTPNYEDVGALPADTSIPEALSDLTDDASHRLVTDTEKTDWNAAVSQTNINAEAIEDILDCLTWGDFSTLVGA